MTELPPLFSWEGRECWARATQIYDGDSFHLIFVDKGQLVRVPCRLEGVDTPELRARSEREKVLAMQARDFVRDKLEGKLVRARLGSSEKYGRTLCSVACEDGSDLAAELIRTGLGRPYSGGARASW